LSVLVDHVPGGSRLALAGRAEPPLRIARLRAEGRILEIGPEDLSLTADEASALTDRGRAAPAADAVHLPVVPRDRHVDVPVPHHHQVGSELDLPKLGASSRSEAVARAGDLGLLDR
jgi:ATP/maltotriose-dependent transcriptional regulator MalT